MWVLNLMNATKLEDLWAWRKYKEKAWGPRSRRMRSKEQRELPTPAPKPWNVEPPAPNLKIIEPELVFFSKVWSCSDPIPPQEPDPWFQFPKNHYLEPAGQFHPGSTTRPPNWFRFLTGSWGQNQFQFGFN